MKLVLVGLCLAALAGCAVRTAVPGASFAVDGGRHYRHADYRRHAHDYAPRYRRRPPCDRY